MYKRIGMAACHGMHFDLAHKALDRAVRKWLEGRGKPAGQAQTPFDIDPRPRSGALLTPAGRPMQY